MVLFFSRRQPRVIWHGEKRQRKRLGEIGNTPLVEINYPGHATILAKAEFLNPTGSHKDRPYLRMVEAMERDGKIAPGRSTLVDYTTGNAGPALAYVGKEKGYRVIVVMPENMTLERIDQIRYYGAELILTDAKEFVRGARMKAEEIVRDNADHVLLNQSDNRENTNACRDIGREVTEFLAQEGKSLSAFVGAIGTGALISGVALALREDDPKVKVVGFEPIESPSSFAAKLGIPFKHRDHNLIGTGPGKVASNTDLELIDCVELIGKNERDEGKKLLRGLKLWLGHTSAAGLCVAKKIARVLGEGNGNVLTIFYDAGWKYYSELPCSQFRPLGRPETAQRDLLRRMAVVVAP